MAASRPAGGERPTAVRYGVLLLPLGATISYLNRIGIANAATTIQREFRIDNQEMGVVLAAFSAGYLWFQIPSGWLGARFGGRATLVVLNLLAALCAVWSGLAASPAMLWAARFGLGTAQAGLVPCTSRAVMDWFPPQRRGMASSAITGSMSVGSVLAAGLTAVLLPVLGWRGIFFVYAAVGLAWVVAFSLGFRNRPEEHPAANAAERALARGGTGAEPPAPSGAPPPSTRAERAQATLRLLAAMATSSSAWLICAQAACRAFGAQFYLTWFPAFLEKGHGIRLEKSGLMAMLPLAGSVFGAVAGGAVIDWLLRRTGSRRLSRSGTAATVLVLSALCTLAATRAEGAMAMVLFLALANFCLGMGGPASWATTMDISGQHTQVVFGLQNMCGNVGAMLCPIVVGALFDRIQAGYGDWNWALILIAVVYLAGAACWAFLNPLRSAVARA